MIDSPPWSRLVKAADGARGLDLDLAPDAAARARLAQAFDVEALGAFEAHVRVRPWLDGLRLQGRWTARVTYACGLTLEPFDADLKGELDMHLVPEGSPHAPDPEAEPSGDPEAEEPPEVYAGEVVDVGDLLAQHLSVEIDPFPRKPGAAFTPPPEPPEPSPFAALAALQPKPE